MQEDGEQIGRFKVRGLMRELALVSNQPGSHAYKPATVERPDIPNTLNLEFDARAPIKSSAATSPTSGPKGNGITWLSYWICTHVELWALSGKPDADLVIKALDMAYEQRGRPQGLLFHSVQGAQYQYGSR